MRSEIIHNKEIDRSKWDAFTTNSSTGHIFNLSWYLDIVFPEWQALILSDDHEWIAVLPLFPRKKYGFQISLQPLLVRYSGVIRKETGFDHDQLLQVTKEALSGFTVCHFTSPFNFLPEKLEKKKVTYKLDISLSYDQIYAGFKGSLRNKIHNFKPLELTIKDDTTTDALIHLFRHYGDIGKFKVTNDYFEKLENLFGTAYEKKMARIVTARNSDMEPVSSLLFFYFADTICLFIGLTRIDYKKTAIHPFLIAEEIKEKSENFKKLDFLGSIIPGVAKFNMSFGALPYLYQEVILKKFPFNLLPV